MTCCNDLIEKLIEKWWFSTQGTVSAQTIFDQKRGQAAATAALGQSLLLEPVHHTGGERHIDPFGFSVLGDLSGSDLLLMVRLKLLLQLLEQILQKRHGCVPDR